MCEISVIVPCWNVEKFVGECLLSIEAQTFKDFEVIFVDDGSTDSTGQILEDFCQKTPNAQVVHKKNGGVASARNYGLKFATGRFVFFFDPDDMMFPQTLALAHKALKNSDAEVLRFNHLNVKEKLTFDEIKKLEAAQVKNLKTEKIEGSEQLLSRFFSRRMGIAVWHWLFPMETLKKFDNFPNIFDETLLSSEDVKFCVQLLTKIQSALSLNACLYAYRVRSGSLVRSEFNETKIQIFGFLEEFLPVVKEKYPKATIYLRSILADLAQEHLCNMARGGLCSEEKIRHLFKLYRSGLLCCLFGKMNPYYTKLRFTEFPYILHARNKAIRRARKARRAR